MAQDSSKFPITIEDHIKDLEEKIEFCKIRIRARKFEIKRCQKIIGDLKWLEEQKSKGQHE